MRPVSLRQRIVDDLVSGALPPGRRLTLDELARRYASSHMPVREAVRELAGADLLEIGPGRTARVRHMDEPFVEALFATRGPLEMMMARRAAARVAPEGIARLHEAERLRLDAVARADWAEAIRANHGFHALIDAFAANQEAERVLDRHRILLAALWQRFGYGEARFPGVAQDHRHLIAALQAGSVDDAGVLMGAHVVKAKQDLLARMALAGRAAA